MKTTIAVKPDPRLKASTTSIDEVYETSKRLEAFTQIAADAVKQLVESNDVAKKYQKELKESDEEKIQGANRGFKGHRQGNRFDHCAIFGQGG